MYLHSQVLLVIFPLYIFILKLLLLQKVLCTTIFNRQSLDSFSLQVNILLVNVVIRHFIAQHCDDVIMTTMASQITSLTIVYSIVYSGVNQRKHQSSASLAFVWGLHRDRWIPRTKDQLRGKCFHLMTSSWLCSRIIVVFGKLLLTTYDIYSCF